MAGFTVIENEWITLADGTRLAARIWMPEGGGPFPAVFEYLPYRKRNSTSPRDDSTYPVFAEVGIVGVRVDIRGSGESDGVIDGEYTERELSDGCEVIAWIAAQAWSNGNVGMMGISWGGFNGFQIAAMKPPALKAVISIASTVDRYNDDIHYKNGCHLSAHMSWAATMLAYQTRAPDPELVGDRWREMWLERLEKEPMMLPEWLGHQRRDAYWKHGSICETFAEYSVPSLVISGWADGYRNTPFKAIEGAPGPMRAVVGPWVHKYPHFAAPKPRWDFHAEALAWWNCWLRDDASVGEVPALRAYILDGPRPAQWREHDLGRWVAVDSWQTPKMRVFGINPQGRLVEGAGEGAGSALIHSPLDTGTAAGDWCTMETGSGMAEDQCGDDAGSLCFETPPLDQEQVFLGQPDIALTLRSAGAAANLIVRVNDIHPDGAATRVTFGALNLAHRDGNETPAPVPINTPLHLRIRLDACGYRFAPGHRIRVALSTSYWPMILPQPVDPLLTLDTASLRLAMPLIGAHSVPRMPEPANPDPLKPHEVLSEGHSQRRVLRDQQTGVTEFIIESDGGRSRHPENHLEKHESTTERWSIRAGDPLSMEGHAEWICRMGRGNWQVKTRSALSIQCSATEWLLSARVEAHEGESCVFSREEEFSIPRDFM
jgi:putative CocE/NonD family hydrolase